MKHLKAYKLFESNDNELKELAYELDDILLDISDEGFPYAYPSLVSKGKLFIEISGNKDGELTFDGGDRFTITNNVKDVIERIVSVSEERGYMCYLEMIYSETKEGVGLEEYVEGVKMRFENNQWMMTGKYTTEFGILNMKEEDLDKPEPINILGRKPSAITIKISKK